MWSSLPMSVNFLLKLAVPVLMMRTLQLVKSVSVYLQLFIAFMQIYGLNILRF